MQIYLKNIFIRVFFFDHPNSFTYERMVCSMHGFRPEFAGMLKDYSYFSQKF